MSTPPWTRLGDGVTAEGSPPPGGWPAPGPTPLLPEAPPPGRGRVAVTGGRREAARGLPETDSSPRG